MLDFDLNEDQSAVEQMVRETIGAADRIESEFFEEDADPREWLNGRSRQ